MTADVSMTNFILRSIATATVSVALAAPLSTASAADDLAFRTPSDNIHCQVEEPFEPGGPTILRCDIMQRDNRPPPRPRDCEQDWGMAFYVMDRDEPGQLMCVGDTVRGNARVLEYGKMWRAAGFECVSQRDGLTCRNATGRGFKLSRKSQLLF